MKARQLLCLLCASVVLLPVAANADIYKWKDRNGTVRYSDTPPPTNVRTSTIGKTGTARPARNAAPVAISEKATPVATSKTSTGKKAPNLEEKVDEEKAAAKIRQRNAEIEKNNKLEKAAQAKLKKENCSAARANHASYAQGGRIYKTNEKGERNYLGDADLKAGLKKTKAEIRRYCR